MSNYIKSTDFAAKDSLASGNAAKIVKGTEIDTEFNNIATAVATKADLASPTFTGTVTAGTANITTLTATTATISGGSVTGITDLAVADGGTGASTAANARVNLGTVADTASNGIAVRTAANTLTARTITAGTGITVTNGDGVSGNPTIANSGVTSVNSLTGAVTTINADTPQSASGTAVDFTSIPSWAKRVTVMFSSVSTNGTSLLQIQLGTSGGVEATGYLGAGLQFIDGSTVSAAASTTGFQIRSGIATNVLSGAIVISNLTSNTWTAHGVLGDSSRNAGYALGGVKSLSGVLDRVRVTTVNGSDQFDAGTINILYE